MFVFNVSVVQRVRFPNFSVLERVLTPSFLRPRFFNFSVFQRVLISPLFNVSVFSTFPFFSTSPCSSDVPVFNYCIQPPFRPTSPRLKSQHSRVDHRTPTSTTSAERKAVSQNLQRKQRRTPPNHQPASQRERRAGGGRDVG